MAILNIKNFPEDLYERLRARAERERRSVAQEVTHLLERALEAPTPRSLLELEGLGRELWGGVDAVRRVAEERASWDE